MSGPIAHSYSRTSRLIAFIVICGFISSRVKSAPALPPELAALDAQFSALQAERVTGPFDEGVPKLNDAYLDRVTKAIAEQKAAGNLDAIRTGNSFTTPLRKPVAGPVGRSSAGY